jgi:Tol biopolymer transport system component
MTLGHEVSRVEFVGCFQQDDWSAEFGTRATMPGGAPIVHHPMRPLDCLARALVASATVIACSGGGGSTGPGRELAAVGRFERGATVRLVARAGVSPADSLVTDVVVTPATAGQVNGTNVRLVETGPLTLSARASDGRPLSLTLDVQLPPSVWFDAAAAGNRDIYRMALDGGELTRLTTTAGDHSHPALTGGAVVFTCRRDGNAEHYSLPAAGGAEARLTTTPSNETEPALSRDGTMVAFVSDAAGAPRVYVAAQSIVGPARLSDPGFGFGGSIESHPSWSPGGDRIALVATPSGGANLFLATSAANSLPAVAPGSGAGATVVEPAWSPDGNLIAFASTRAGTTQIFLLDLRTGTVSQLTSGPTPAGQPAWLPDGRLVFTRFDGSATSLWWTETDAPGTPVQIPLVGLSAPGDPAGDANP